MRRNLYAPRRALALLAAAVLLTLSACQSEELESTPGAADVSPLYTAAAQTLTAQQAPEVPLLIVTATPAAPPTTIVVVPNTGAVVPMPVTGGGAGATTAPGVCENATFLSDVTVPDGTVVSPGQSFVKTWAVSNSGTCPLTTSDRLVLVNGDPMGGSDVPLAGTVAVGEAANLSINLTAPVVPGTYTGTWRMKNASGNYFGDVVTVVITVGGAADP